MQGRVATLRSIMPRTVSKTSVPGRSTPAETPKQGALGVLGRKGRCRGGPAGDGTEFATHPVMELSSERTSGEWNHVKKLLGDLKTGMLITRDYRNGIHARPMMIAEVDDDVRISFITSVAGEKIEEVLRDPQVGVTLQRPGAFVAISGRAEVVLDAAEKQRVWSRLGQQWFHGPSDPRAGLISVRPERVEYWDKRGLRWFESALQALVGRALGQDQQLRLNPGGHGYSRLRA